MTLRNSDRFITAFNRIDQTLKDIVGAKDYLSFTRLLEFAKKRNAIIRKYEDDLREFADLRNAIVHHRTSAEYAIAEPHDDIVELIETIDQILSAPVTVGEMFLRNVIVFQSEDTLKFMLRSIQNRKFTQIPVYEGKEFEGLLTAVGITNWLANNVDQNNISLETTTLSDILQFEGKGRNYRFVEKETPVYEAAEIFKHAVSSGNRLEALLITETGEMNEPLLGIMVPIDLAKID